MRAGARVIGVALAGALVAGCGAGGAGGSTLGDERREWRVAEDPDATTAEIIDAGGPSDVAVAADGERRVVTWRVEPEDDEGSSWGAWRLYDADGDAVADGHFAQVQEQGASIQVTAVPDGFVLADYAVTRGPGRLLHLDDDGRPTPVTAGRGREPVGPGDVLVDSDDTFGARAYHPDERAAYRVPALPTRNPQAVALDAQGVLHVLLPWRGEGRAVVASSVGGDGPWRRTTLPITRGAYPGLELVATQDALLLPTMLPNQDFGQVEAVWRRPAGVSGQWTSTPVEQDLDVGEARPLLLDDTLLLTGESTWVSGPDGFEQVELPDEDASVEVEGGRLWALGRRSNDLWVSDDLGASWEEVER